MIDKVTGLPELPKNQFWRVEAIPAKVRAKDVHSREYWEMYWNRYGYNSPKSSYRVSLIEVSEEIIIKRRVFKPSLELINKVETVISSADIRVKLTEGKYEDNYYYVEPTYSTALTAANIKSTAEGILKQIAREAQEEIDKAEAAKKAKIAGDAERAKIAQLLGDYPPKTLKKEKK